MEVSTVMEQRGAGLIVNLYAGGKRPWFVTLMLQGIGVRFKIGTGANANYSSVSV